MSLFYLEGALTAVLAEELETLVRRREAPGAALEAVRPLAEAVRARGDSALRDLTERFDGARIDTLEVPRAEWDAALAGLPEDVVEALETARDAIAKFHASQLRSREDVEVTPGLLAGRRYLPIERVGVYVPGGRAAYPSTVLMTATPARVAGVREIVVATPPGKDGRVPAATLAACAIAGVDRVFRVGGAQAVFALAYGTESVPRVHKIVGPGNAFVAAAKALVAGEVAIDAPAGPSEVLVVADDTADARFVAADLLAQAEHDPRAACVALATSPRVAAAIKAEVARQLEGAPRAAVIREALASRGGLLVSRGLDDALAFADRYAPEHLSLAVSEPEAALARVSNYGSAFLGSSPVALGDYCAGPNHVLPTMGLAASYSGLSVDDFVRRPTHQKANPQALSTLGPLAARLAELEGLPAHAASLRLRIATLGGRQP